MKKIFRNVVAAFAAVMLVSAFASCSDSDDGDDKKDDGKGTTIVKTIVLEKMRMQKLHRHR